MTDSQQGADSQDRAEAVSRLPNGYYLQLGVPEEEVNILELWEAITSRKLLIFLVVLGFALFTGFIASILPKQYQGEAVVMIVPASKSTTGSTSEETTVDLNMPYAAGEITSMIQGRSFLYPFIRDNDLLHILFEKNWNKEEKRWEFNWFERLIYGDSITIQDGYDKLTSKLDVATDEETGLTTVSIKWTDPKLAAEWSNKLVDEANRKLRDHIISESEAVLAQLEAQLRRTPAVELRQALYDLMETQMARIISARVHPEFVLKVVDRAVEPKYQAIPYLQLILVVVGIFLGLIFALSLVLLLNTIGKHKSRGRTGAVGKRNRPEKVNRGVISSPAADQVPSP